MQDTGARTLECAAAVDLVCDLVPTCWQRKRTCSLKEKNVTGGRGNNGESVRGSCVVAHEDWSTPLGQVQHVGAA